MEILSAPRAIAAGPKKRHFIPRSPKTSATSSSSKKLRSDTRKYALTKALFETTFYSRYIPIVVLANSKTILNDRFAPREVRKQVIRADQLAEYIRKANAADSASSSESEMMDLAQFFIDADQKRPEADRANKYHSLEVEHSRKSQAPLKTPPACPRCGAPMVLRKATKGNNAGGSFYGCSTFPKCRAILPA